MPKPEAGSGSTKRYLGDVDAAAAKTALAIHQIIAPEVVEGLAEFVELSGGHGLVIAFAPLAERFGIVEAETVAVLPGEAALLGQRFEARLVEQHAAGENIGLDEVGAGRVTGEQAV